MKKNPRASGLLQSGIILSAVGFLSGLGNYAFQAIIGGQLSDGEYGLVNNTLAFAGFLGLPMAIASQAVTHYIARFHFSGDDARLRGLLAGCRKFLFRLTIAGSVLAVLLVKPLSDFFHFPRTSLMLIALLCVLAGLWGGFAGALCQGLSWFKRLALIGFLAMCLRLAFCGIVVLKFPMAETAVLASVFMLLSNLVLLFWKKDLVWHAEPVSPWNREFVQFLIVSTACVGGGYFFSQGDQLVAQRYFLPADRGHYSAAERLAIALPMTVGPLLAVLFTHRSGRHHHHGDDLREQMKLLGLYAAGLICGAILLFALRVLALKIIGKYTPESAAMIAPLALTMTFVGLVQAFAMWALASRWIKIALLYGGLGLGYWLALLCLGKSPAELLRVMPVAAGAAFGVLFVFWIIAMRRHKPAVQS
jgi:O-antigen/teichoic acid export membrane protein